MRTRDARSALTNLALLVATAMPAAAGLPGDECLDVVGHWPYGPIQALHSDGSRAYVASGSAALIVDTTVPSAPTVLGSVELSDPVWEITVTGDLLAVADRWDTISFVDITDPASAAVVGRYQFASGPAAYDVAVAGDYAFVAVRELGLYVLDISDVSAPVKVAELVYPGISFVFDIEVEGTLAFMAADALGVLIVDISTPTSPQPLSSFPTPDASDLEVVGSTVYLADGSFGFKMVDVSDPMHPGAAGTVTFSDYSGNLDVAGDYAYVGGLVNGMHVVRVSGPGAPVEEGTFAAVSFDVAVVGGGYVYASDADPVRTSQLHLVDVSNPALPVATDTFTTHSYAKGVTGAGNRAYVADGTGGLVILSLLDPANPVRRSTLDTPGDARTIGLVGTYAYVADWGDVQVADVSNAASPFLLAPVSLPGSVVYDLAVAGDRVYVANGDGGLRVLDASTPSSPVVEGSWLAPGGAAITRVAAEGNGAVVMSGSTGWLLDVSNPASPGGAVTFTVPYAAQQVAMNATHIYVADGAASGLHILDRATLAAVAVYAPWPLDAVGVTLDGTRAYLSGGTFYGVIVLDVSDPANPNPVASYNTAGDAQRTALVNGRVVVADWDNGVLVLGCPAVFADGFEGGDLSEWSFTLP